MAAIVSRWPAGLLFAARTYARAPPRIPVLLLQDVEHLGLKGDVVRVTGMMAHFQDELTHVPAAGHARNYLVPTQKAAVASPAMAKANIGTAETLAARRKIMGLQTQVTKLGALSINFTRTVTDATSGTVQTGVTAANIAAQIEKEAQVAINMSQVTLAADLKALGTYSVPITIDKSAYAEHTQLLNAYRIPDTVQVTVNVTKRI